MDHAEGVPKYNNVMFVGHGFGGDLNSQSIFALFFRNETENHVIVVVPPRR